MFNFDVKDFTLKKLIDFLFSFELILLLFLGSGLLLFLPERIIERIYLSNIKEQSGTFIGSIFFLSLIVTLVKIILFLSEKIKNKYSEKKNTKNLEKILLNLNKKEKKIIKEIFDSDENTVYLPLHSGVVKKLETQRIIGKTMSSHMTSAYDPTFPYALQPWAYDYFEENPDYFS